MLAAKLDKLAIQIGKGGAVVAGLCVIFMIVRFCIETFGIENKPWKNSYFSNILEFFITGVTILVVAVPEGLPLAVTLSLAFSGRRMHKVRRRGVLSCCVCIIVGC